MNTLNTDTGKRSTGPGSRDPSRLIGAAFGQYQIVELLGAGGMGEVWRARDTRLDREVALKTLPEELASSPERMARLTREAKTLASLNHPNIAMLYGLEHLPLSRPPSTVEPRPPTPAGAESSAAASARVLVMELVEGETLEEIIGRGPMPFAAAARLALQIAEGLQAAHERGVVHRDLKPANIKVRPDGAVKVLDFGLATMVVAPSADQPATMDPTVSLHRTAIGTVMGTAAYMSPEQARGGQVDRRTDIWSFGCLLFEMLTGTKPFHGETFSDTLAAVLKDEPNWTAMPHGLEPVARHVLRRCLAKDRDRRFHDIADVRIELEEAVAVATATPEQPGPGWARRAAWPITAVATAALAAAATLGAMRAPDPSPPTFHALSYHSGRVASARFTPDGTTVVYGMSSRDRPQGLVSTRTDSVESRPLDLPPADVLGISRSGRMAILLDRHCEGSWVSVGTLAVADLAGGAPRAIMARVNDGDISTDGTELAAAREAGSMQRLEFPLGTVLFETAGWISHVRIAPDAEHVAFLHHPYYGDDRGLVAMVDRSGELSELTDELSDSLQGLAWSPDGSSIWFSAFVFGKGGVVWTVRPGEAPLEVLGAPISLRVQDVAADGRVLLTAGDTRAEIAGRLAGTESEQRYEGWNDDSIGGIAADGSLIAGNIQVSTVDGEYAAFVRRADGSPPVRLGYGDVFGVSPDGSWIFTRKLTSSRSTLFMVPTGAGEPRTIDLGGIEISTSSSEILSCTFDGRLAAFATASPDGPRICVLNLEDGTTRLVGAKGARGALISPDGVRVVAVAPDGRATVYPIEDGPPLVVPGLLAGEVPLQWSQDGRSILVWNRVFPARIHRVALSDGDREPVLEIMPDDPAGVLYGSVLLAPGAEHYVYRYRRDVSTLFLVSDLD